MQTPSAITGFLSEGQPSILVRPHWILLMGGAIFFCLAVAVSLFGWQIYANMNRHGSFLILPALLGFWALGVAIHFSLAAVTRLIAYYFSYLLITPDYVVTLTGIARNVRSLEKAQIESRPVDETLLGRLLSYGYLHISGTGGARLGYFPIPQPHQVYNQLIKMIP